MSPKCRQIVFVRCVARAIENKTRKQRVLVIQAGKNGMFICFAFKERCRCSFFACNFRRYKRDRFPFVMAVASFVEKIRGHCSHLLLGSARLLACSGQAESFLPQAAHTRNSRYASKCVYKERALNTMTLLC